MTISILRTLVSCKDLWKWINWLIDWQYIWGSTVHEEYQSQEFGRFICFELPWIWKSVFWEAVYLYVHTYVKLCTSLTPQWLDEFYSNSVFSILSNICWCVVNMNILAPKIEAPQISPWKRNDDFFQNLLKKFWWHFSNSDLNKTA
jgi:hypothetical protein